MVKKNNRDFFTYKDEYFSGKKNVADSDIILVLPIYYITGSMLNYHIKDRNVNSFLRIFPHYKSREERFTQFILLYLFNILIYLK